MRFLACALHNGSNIAPVYTVPAFALQPPPFASLRSTLRLNRVRLPPGGTSCHRWGASGKLRTPRHPAPLPPPHPVGKPPRHRRPTRRTTTTGRAAGSWWRSSPPLAPPERTSLSWAVTYGVNLQERAVPAAGYEHIGFTGQAWQAINFRSAYCSLRL